MKRGKKAANNGALTRQQKAALTRKANRDRLQIYLQGFMSGYLLGGFDASHGYKRSMKAIERIAESNAESHIAEL